MAKRSDFPRRKNDLYHTPIKGMEPLLPFIRTHSEKKISFIEPCAGDGRMVDFFVENGHICKDYFDIDPQRDDIKIKDAFDYPIQLYQDCDYIITNPPWTRKILHPMIDLFSSVRPTWLLFDANWLFTKQAYPYLRYCHKVVSIGRLKWIEDSLYSSKDDSAWYLFDKNKIRQSEGPVIYGTK